MATSTTYGARDHARAQEGARAEAMPVVPASAWPSPPCEAERLVWAETVAGGNYTHRVLARGTELRLADLHGDACAHLLLYAADRPWERLNVADTVKVQWNAYLREGVLLLSDQGRVLASVVADTSGRHDALCGTSTLARNTERYGDGAPQSPSPAGRELFKLAAAKNGLGPRDLPPSLSFFQGVEVRDDGTLDFTGSTGPGGSVTLRAEQDVTVLIANVPHPIDPRPEYVSTALEVLAWRAEPTRPGDPLWEATPEGRRAFLNTAEFLAARGIA
ncbi:urea carboxylase-associated family protein [Streptomyces ipomoeae]|uniref:Urea carboxylase-associated protein 2 n=1 Tax=Streptomyces ipomoeae 91-03 TaxID=698759 RepID=L1KQV1_9ACTN|nr:urea amidolyase associated protein UAAP1 [Streptomyces ipomoeae]EKX62992.1 urea carboxylase-associated protein 2 [Streptomyces ipomoeae 91-03]MDX2696479.1 urea carboxylase-associated family protein [Streptomyces ipomoeae]MDX2824261.1 urea carboxylase-associated family protein [Streptomyces ipomoeae]MDX2840851.1 urea carboxylase-associated family protein [Streptomyces ipomoeae]MDX2877198.1 urea carboxylase-associated family protein [Streptomyces ipomoeae]